MHQCINQNFKFFELINDYATDGYCFWEVGKKDRLLIDKKLSDKLEFSENDEIHFSQLNTERKDYFNTITTELEFELSKRKDGETIAKTTVELSREKLKIHYSTFHLDEEAASFVLAAIEIHDDYYRPIKKVSDALDLAIWQWNIKTNELIVNEKWANIIGYTLEELEPITVQTFIDVTHPDDGESTLKLAEDYLSGQIK